MSIHMPNAKHASDVDLRLSLLIPLDILLLLPALVMVLEQDVNSRRRLAGRASHTGPAAKPGLSEERLNLALSPPSPPPCTSPVAREPAIACTAAEVGHLDALAAALIPHLVVAREPRKLAPKVPQRGEEGKHDNDHTERNEPPLRLAREVVSALVEQPAVQASHVAYK